MHAVPIIWSLRASKLGRYRGWGRGNGSARFSSSSSSLSFHFFSPLFPFSYHPLPPAADGRGDLEGLQFA